MHFSELGDEQENASVPKRLRGNSNGLPNLAGSTVHGPDKGQQGVQAAVATCS
jgi:hypothetical protein